MLLTKPHKTVILKRLAFVIFCMAIGWYLKGKMTPSMGMGGFGAGTPYVLMQTVALEDTAKADTHIGHVEAINSVNIQPKVGGTLEAVHFEEGSFVKEGDVLFTIEPEIYEATLNLRKAELERAKASLTEAERNYNRQIKLSKQNIASKATFDNAESNYLQSKANVAQAEANLALAQINYDYTFVKAPINGYIGKALATKGNSVVASTNTLARIVQLNPVRVAFTLTDKEFIAFKSSSEKQPEMKARITLPDGTVLVKDFKAGFVDNEVSTSTATVSIYGDFENDAENLIPGSYVQIALILKPELNIVVPQASLAQDENGFYTYVITDDDVAEERRLVMGDVIGDKQIVKSGLKEGEKVVIKGIQKLSNGAKVKAALVTPATEL
ncbi:MAG TPA: efflux RND transporter periplasmic adaptor subunit [Alphaproteobacteria bacterium]|nr:efflux RND transporter periplasmic adaptor subunit [Alphaproteobacteria bacterium]